MTPESAIPGWSRARIDRLGDRIRKSPVVLENDRGDLRSILAAHIGPMERVQERLQELLGLPVRARPKTEKSTIEKLKRNPRLSTIQDLAGVRIILSDPDPACAAVIARRAKLALGGRCHDRRLHPSHGYRALHLIVEIDGCHIEVQIRTRLQHRWAEIFEKLADRVGRGTRYGEPASSRDQPLVDAMMSASSVVQSIEGLRRQLARRERRILRLQDRISHLPTTEPVVEQLRQEVDELFRELSADRTELEDFEKQYIQQLDGFERFVERLNAQAGDAG